MTDYTNGAPYLITQTEDVGEFSRRIHFLLPDGRRHGVVIEQALDSPQMRAKLAAGLLEGRTNLTKERRQ